VRRAALVRPLRSAANWHVRVRRCPTRYNLYKNTVEHHIKPQIENTKLSRLSKSDFYRMLDNVKAKKGNGDRTRQVVHSTLHRAIQVAFKRDKVARNVVALVDKPTSVKKRKRSPENLRGGP
jgi:hypothetical protein